MAEFFIARPWRRRGIGAQAVRLMLDRFTGQWLITEYLSNTAAVKFWRRVVYAYTGGKYQERIVNGEVHQRFESGSRRPRARASELSGLQPQGRRLRACLQIAQQRSTPVTDSATSQICSGVPAATTRPPRSPPSGPRSIT